MQDLADMFLNNHRPDKKQLEELERKHDNNFGWEKLPEVMKKYGVKL